MQRWAATKSTRQEDLIWVGYWEAEDNALSQGHLIALDVCLDAWGCSLCPRIQRQNSRSTVQPVKFLTNTAVQTIFINQLVCLQQVHTGTALTAAPPLHL